MSEAGLPLDVDQPVVKVLVGLRVRILREHLAVVDPDVLAGPADRNGVPAVHQDLAVAEDAGLVRSRRHTRERDAQVLEDDVAIVRDIDADPVQERVVAHADDRLVRLHPDLPAVRSVRDRSLDLDHVGLTALGVRLQLRERLRGHHVTALAPGRAAVQRREADRRARIRITAAPARSRAATRAAARPARPVRSRAAA